MVSRSRMMATRVQDDIDEEAPAPRRKANRMSLCNARAMWATAGSYNGGGIPGTCSILHRQVVANSVKIKSRARFLRKGARSHGPAQ